MPDTPSMQSDCEDSIAEAIPLRTDDIYESCVYDSYYDKSPPKSRPISTYSDSATIVPRIVITPTPEDNEKRRTSWTNDESNDRITNQNETFEKLTTKLNQIYSNETKTDGDGDGVESKNVEFMPFGDNQEISNKQQSARDERKSNFASSKILQHSQELDSSESESQTEQNDMEKQPEAYDRKRNDSLCEIEDIRESEVHSDDESADIIEFIIDNSGDATSNCDTVEFNDHLSVIFEDDEQSHNQRIRLDSMCSSNSSATLANDNGSKHFDSDVDKEDDDDCSTVESDTENNTDNESDSDDEDDQSTSVTVRLPLRLSFSRSSNDEEITTVMVGKSEIEIEENIPSSKTPIVEDSSPDVSVSISLRPKSRPSYSQQSSIDTSNNEKSFDNNDADDDSEVSVCVSLPLRHKMLSPAPMTHRPAFRRQQTLSPVPYNRDEFEYKRWDRSFSVDRTTNIQKPQEHHWNERNDFIDKHNNTGNASNVTEFVSNHNVDNANVEGINSHTNEDISTTDDSHCVEPENLSVRAKIAAFETIPISRKDEFQRQNACTSMDEPIEQANIQYNNDYLCENGHKYEDNKYEGNKYEEEKKYEANNSYNENTLNREDYAYYGNSPQTEPQTSMNIHSNGIEHNSRTVTPNYESYSSNEYTQSPHQFVEPQFIDSQHEYPQQSYMEQAEYTHHSESSENNSEGSEDPEKDYKANLSVSQKIATFERPSTCPPTNINVQRDITYVQEISAAREMNNKPESIGNRFLAKVNEAQTQKSDAIRAQKIEAQKSFECEPQKLYDPQIEPQSNRNAKLNKMHSAQRSTLDESELEETDSGVDIHRQISEDIDTESECYSELRKLTRYERAQTHSRLFKILQEYDSEASDMEKSKADEEILPLNRPKKIVHNVSITRKQNPDLVKQAETMAERRERLHLNHNSSSIDADNPSSSASPSCLSPTPSVNEKLIDELVQSVLKQTKRRNLRNIPIEKIQSAARKAWIQQQEENDSCDTYSSFDSTPALTPQEFHDDYYDSDADANMDIFPSKAFKHLQEQSVYGRKNKLWAARCPRVLSSKTVNSDLSRVTETEESQTPERDQQYVYIQ